MDEAEQFLGPGYYEQQSIFEQGKGPGGKGDSKFLSNAPRFREGKEKKAEGGVPGPGHYSNDDLNNWFKRSYNMIFTE